MRVHGARRDLGLDPPHVGEQGIARLDAAAPRHELVKQAKLERGEADLRIIHPGAVRVAVDAQAAEADDRGLGVVAARGIGATEEGADAQHELAHAERLHDVIVGADLEADDAIDLLALRRTHDHGDVASALGVAEPAADLGAREVGQHEIEHDHVGEWVTRGGSEPGAAGVREANLEPLRAQVVLDGGGEIDFILDDQHEHGSGLARAR